MAFRFDVHLRLESVHTVNSPSAVRSAMRAEVSDPAWFLGRQWQLGEHRGNDAAFPTLVHLEVTETPVRGRSEQPEDDPRVTPPEVIIEAEPEQWWTIGRRVRVGMALQAALPVERRDDPTLRVRGAAAPYSHLNGVSVDGLLLHRNRASLGLADSEFTDLGMPAAEPPDNWVPSDLAYSASFSAGRVTLDVPRHDGGEVDWYSVTATGPDPPETTAPKVATSYPTRVRIPGGPHPRWWQIEDARLDPGGVAPARSHLTPLFLIRATSAKTDGWFTAPLVVPTGTLVGVLQMTVVDSMDLSSTSVPVQDWSMYHLSGRPAHELLLWPTVEHPLTASAVLDQIDVGLDEDANLLWAVERWIDGVEAVESDPASFAAGPRAAGEVPVNRRRQFRYQPASDVPDHWHPYVVTTAGTRRYHQARLVDFDKRPVVPRPGPTSRLLQDPAAGATEPYHAISPDVVPRAGVQLDRRFVLGRSTTGAPLLWVQRRRSALPAPPTSRLRFDILETILP